MTHSVKTNKETKVSGGSWTNLTKKGGNQYRGDLEKLAVVRNRLPTLLGKAFQMKYFFITYITSSSKQLICSQVILLKKDFFKSLKKFSEA